MRLPPLTFLADIYRFWKIDKDFTANLKKMKLIVGLGNPGSKYRNTRHNVGHWALEAMDKKLPEKGMKEPFIWRRKTTVFMNESGRELKKIISDIRLSQVSNLLVIHDDLDLSPGEWKMQFGRGPAGHNGVKSIIEELGTKDFWRLRIGVGKPDKAGDKYVLEEPNLEEIELIENAIADSLPRVLEWASQA